MKPGKFIHITGRLILLFIWLPFFTSLPLYGQVSLVPGISVKKLAAIKPMAVRIVYDMRAG